MLQVGRAYLLSNSQFYTFKIATIANVIKLIRPKMDLVTESPIDPNLVTIVLEFLKMQEERRLPHNLVLARYQNIIVITTDLILSFIAVDSFDYYEIKHKEP